MTALAIVGLLPPGAQRRGGRVLVNGVDAEKVAGLRGGIVGMVLQEAASALNPVLSIGYQLAETVAAHGVGAGRAARVRAAELLREVALDDVESMLRAYPHQLSGGQAQRAMLALALAGDPDLVIADEPTTALDVLTQRKILDLLGRIADERGIGLLLVTHALAVVAELVDRVVVLDGGRVIEEAATDSLLAEPKHPTSRRIVEAAVELFAGTRRA